MESELSEKDGLAIIRHVISLSEFSFFQHKFKLTDHCCVFTFLLRSVAGASFGRALAVLAFVSLI